MNDDIRARFEQFKRTPFPEMGKLVGDFAFYDALMAGTVSSFLEGTQIAPDAIPVPDRETQEMLSVLKEKANPTEQEDQFLNYAELLAELRAEIAKSGMSTF